MKSARYSTVCAMLGLAACHGDSNPVPVAVPTFAHKAQAPVKKPGPTPEEQTAGMVEAATAGKSTVPVELKFDLAERPLAGHPLTLNLALLSQISADSATLQVAEAPGLQLAPGGAVLSIQNVGPLGVYRHEVQVTPAAEGIFFLGVTVSLKHDEITESRAFSVPIIVLSEKELAANAKH